MGSAEQEEVISLTTYRAEHLDQSLMDRVVVLAEREGGLYDCYVPVELIDFEEVPVKQGHAEEIARDMRAHKERHGGTGQHAPVQVGLVEGEELFKIVDGFHRDAAVRTNGEATIYATVQKMTWDDLYDQRIFTAKDHSQVRFSRVIQWMREIWEKSEFSELETSGGNNLTLKQATSLLGFDNSGKKLGLDPYDVDKVKDWVRAKEERWGMKAMTFHGYLEIAENVDPGLVHSARERGGGSDKLEAPTQTILKEFSKHIPRMFDLQKYIMQAAAENASPSKAVQSLAAELSSLISNIDDEDEILLAAKAYVDGYQWHDAAKRGAGASQPKTKQLRQASDPRSQGMRVFRNASDIVNRATLRTSIAREESGGISESERGLVQEAIDAAKNIRQGLGSFVIEASKLIGVEPEHEDVAEDDADQAAEQPQERGKRHMREDLNQFGIVTNEDWAAFPDHHKLALSIFSPNLWGQRHESPRHALVKAFQEAGLDGNDESLSSEDIYEAALYMVKTLKAERGGPEPYVRWDADKARLYIEQRGMKHLREVFRKTLLNIDESK
jgi:hypothetical protein